MKYFILFFTLILLTSCANTNASGASVEKKTEAVQDTSLTDIAKKRKAVNDSLRKEKESEQRYFDSFVLKNYIVPPGKNQDITVIKSSCAVFINPSDEQIEQLKKENGEENFSIIADDQMYYAYEAQNFFKENKIDCLLPTTRYLKFVTPDGDLIIDTRAKVSYGWLSILFNSDSLPKILSPIDMPGTYKTYFGK